MPDLQMRFHADMLVLSAPIDAALEKQGIDVESEREFLSLNEPETILEALRMESVAGAACMVTPTNGITEARLAHFRMQDKAAQMAQAALSSVHSLTPQHVLAEIGPTMLPIDPSGKQSLVANRDQYSNAVKAFSLQVGAALGAGAPVGILSFEDPAEGLDAFFLNGMVSIDDMRCALMGVRKMCDTPVIASVNVDGKGNLVGRHESIEQAADVMEEFEADAVGFSTKAPLDQAAKIAERLVRAVDLPVLVQLEVDHVDNRQGEETPENPYFCADTMVGAAMRLRDAGAQFLRATGAATPAYTGALAVSTMGVDSIR